MVKGKGDLFIYYSKGELRPVYIYIYIIVNGKGDLFTYIIVRGKEAS
jgi:hypothetical protein